MSNPLAVPYSRELLNEHARRHAAEHAIPAERLRGHQATCPCGRTVVLLCALCDWPIFVAVRQGTYCEHAREMDEWEQQLGPH